MKIPVKLWNNMKRSLFIALVGIVLTMPWMAQEWEHEIMSHATTGYEAPEKVAPMRINTLADAVTKRPALPTVADLMSPEAKAAYARNSVNESTFFRFSQKLLRSLLNN